MEELFDSLFVPENSLVEIRLAGKTWNKLLAVLKNHKSTLDGLQKRVVWLEEAKLK